MSKYGKLTVARSEGQSITVTTAFGEEIEITLHSFQGKQCRVTINAPVDIGIARTELIERADAFEFDFEAD